MIGGKAEEHPEWLLIVLGGQYNETLSKIVRLAENCSEIVSVVSNFDICRTTQKAAHFWVLEYIHQGRIAEPI